MQKGVIVRHLVIPNEIQNSFDVLDWIYKNLGKQTYISVMGQYTPYYLITQLDKYTKYNRPLKPIEYKRVISRLNNLGFSNGFWQDLTSSSENFIPNFNKFSDV